MTAARIALRWSNAADVVDMQEALALSTVDVVRPEDLDVSSPLAGRLQRAPAADDLRLPKSPMKSQGAAQLKASVRSVREKSAQPLAVEPERAEKIFRLSAFLRALEAIQEDIDAARQPLD
jgi:hypothetical protein